MLQIFNLANYLCISEMNQCINVLKPFLRFAFGHNYLSPVILFYPILSLNIRHDRMLMKQDSPMSFVFLGTRRRSKRTILMASRRISKMLLIRASRGARGNAATNMVVKLNWTTTGRVQRQVAEHPSDYYLEKFFQNLSSGFFSWPWCKSIIL